MGIILLLVDTILDNLFGPPSRRSNSYHDQFFPILGTSNGRLRTPTPIALTFPSRVPNKRVIKAQLALVPEVNKDKKCLHWLAC
jgi:hypothetical protein